MAGRNHTGKLWTVSKVLTRVPQVSERPTHPSSSFVENEVKLESALFGSALGCMNG